MEHVKKFVLVDPAQYKHSEENKLNSSTNALQSAAHNKLSNLDSEIVSIVNSEETDDVKAKRYSIALQKFRDLANRVSGQSTVNEENYSHETEVLDSVPPQYRHKAKRLLKLVKNSDDIQLTKEGELIYKQSKVPKSDIVELINDLLKYRGAGEAPAGWSEFAKVLSNTDITKELVPNAKRWKDIQSQLQQPVVLPKLEETTPITGKHLSEDSSASVFLTPKAKRRKSASSSKKKRKKRLSKLPRLNLDEWEEY